MNIRSLARIVAGTSLAATILGLATPSHASRMIQNTSTGRVTAGAAVACNDPGGFAHWTAANTNWFHNTANQGTGKATALQNAMASWTNVASANHVLTYAGTTALGFATDGQNSVDWATGSGCSGNCLALTALVLQAGQVIIESDITFNDASAWRTNGTDFDTEAVAAHEFGHALGLHHTNVTTAPTPTMSTPYFGTDGRTLDTDDTSALQCSQNRYCVPAVGARPASLNVIRGMCYGLNDADWPAVTGATRYELYRSSSAAFTTQTLLYSGPNTFDSFNVSATSYLRVRACNACGCSGYRPGNRTATYTSGCF